MRTSDGSTETLARYTTSGGLLATLFTQPDAGFVGRLEWLYGTSGTDVVFEQLLTHAPSLRPLSDRPAMAGGWFRRISLIRDGA